MQTKTRTEPRSRISFALSVGMHLAFVAVLFFAINWKTKPPAPVMAELWTPPPAAEPQPAPRPVPKPAPPPKVVPPPEPKVEAKPPEKVDIALEQEKERKRLEEAERKRLEAVEQKRREAEAARKREEAEKKRKEEEVRRQAEAEEKRREAEARAKVEHEKKEREARIAADKQLVAELERETRERMARELAKAPAQSAQREGVSASVSGDPNAVAGYVDKIRGKIQGNVILPTTIAGNPDAEFLVQQLPTGELLSVKLTRSSGNKLLDAAWERAIWKSSPLPIPEQREVFQSTLRLKFRPSDKQ